jgi:fatty-acyl-CoA synthase
MPRNPFASDWLRGSGSETQRPQGGMSYVAGTSDDPLQFITIDQLLDNAVRDYGAGEAAVFCDTGVSLSWHDLRRRADDVAAGLLALGIERGDRVGIWAPNCWEWLAVQFGTARIGAILVNINPAYRASELEYALNKVQCRVLVMARSLKSSDYVAILRSIAPELIYATAGERLRIANIPKLRHVVLIGDGPAFSGMWSYGDFTRLAGPAHRNRLPGLAAALDPDDAINIQFTSGTTGAPKGATLSHFNIVNNSRYCALAMRMTDRDRLCIPVPLYHIFGMVLGVLVCTNVGAKMVFPAPTFDPESTLRAAQALRCTALHGVPTMFMAMLDHPRFAEFDLSSLRTGMMAGAPCPIETMRRVVSAMHMNEVTIGYGMTETSPVSTQSAVDDPLEKRVTTVGRIQPHAEVKIVDAQGRIVPPRESCTHGGIW